jgi:GNAT superfamily N-acetyltransferase
VIREATHQDKDAIVVMAARFLSTTQYGRLFRIDLEMLENLVDIVLTSGVIFVATIPPLRALDVATGDISGPTADEFVGFLAAVEATEPFSGDRYADEIAWFVMPEHRGGSFGPRLLASLVRWADDKRLSFVKMVAPADSPDVAGFYQQVGFEVVETSYVKRLR